MEPIVKKSFNEPEDLKKFEKLKAEFVEVDGIKMKRVTAQPGWQWSKHLKPVEGGTSCQRRHVFWVVSGKLRVRMVDGKEVDFKPGDLGIIPPGHDGWNAGDEPLVWLEMLR